MMPLNGRRLKIEWEINIVSAINLVALLGLLFTAISTWYGLVSRVDQTQIELHGIREKISEIAVQREEMRENSDAISQSLASTLAGVNNRLSKVETAIEFLTKAIDQLENKLDTP